MNKFRLERLYEERGLKDYKLRTLEDLFYIHDIKLNQVDGYNRLTKDEKRFFSRFVINYFNSYELARRNIFIIKVGKANNYLRVESIYNGEWRIENYEFGFENKSDLIGCI